jgi:hypothetical protein
MINSGPCDGIATSPKLAVTIFSCADLQLIGAYRQPHLSGSSRSGERSKRAIVMLKPLV